MMLSSDRIHANPKLYTINGFSLNVRLFFHKRSRVIILVFVVILALVASRALLSSRKVALLGDLTLTRDATYRADKEIFIKSLHAWNSHQLNGHIGVPSVRVLSPAALDKNHIIEKRTLVIYSYSHASWRQENLEFFLRHGLVTHTADGGEVDYTFVFNGYESPDSFNSYGIKFTSTFIAKGSSLEDLLETETSQKDRSESESGETSLPRIHAVFRENSGFDICSSRIVIEYGLAPRSGTYTHLVLMNGSVRGPFLPSYVTSTWIDMFQQFLQNNVRLVGTTIHCLSALYDVRYGFSSLHAQSMVLALDAVGVRALLPVLQCYPEYTEAINHGEIGISQSILKAGYGLTALQGSWRGVSIFEKDLNSSEVRRRCEAVSDNTGGDPNFPGVYIDGTVHPLEVIFIKTNRKLDPEILMHETKVRNSFFKGVHQD